MLHAKENNDVMGANVEHTLDQTNKFGIDQRFYMAAGITQYDI